MSCSSVSRPEDPCGLCNRPLGELRVQWHHLIPKTFKGKVLVPLHQICHQKIHTTFTERELLNWYHTFERLLDHLEIQKFVAWVKKKPLEFYVKNDDTAERKRKRKR